MSERDFNDFERSVVQALLEGSHPALDALRAQWTVAELRKREVFDEGFLTDLWIPEGPAPLHVAERFALDDVFAEVEGEPEICLLLHVNRGRVQTLEAYSTGGKWSTDQALVRTWNVRPDPENAGQLSPCSPRDLAFALRGLEPREDDDGTTERGVEP